MKSKLDQNYEYQQVVLKIKSVLKVGKINYSNNTQNLSDG